MRLFDCLPASVRRYSIFTGVAVALFTVLGAAPAAVASEPWQGAYLYDGSGNIRAIGPNHYRYDAVGRLVEATAITSAQNSVRGYSYDAFGNLTEVRVDGDDAHARVIGASSASNRMTDSSRCLPGTTCVLAEYDEAGHQVTGGANAGYVFDEVDMMAALDEGSRHEVYIYDAQDERIAIVANAGSTAASWRYTLRDGTEK